MIGDPQVGFSIVEAVIVYVVNDETSRGFHYLAMHRDADKLSAFSTSSIALGIKGIQGSVSTPLVLAEALIIVRVDDSELAPGEGYAAEGVAVANAAI